MSAALSRRLPLILLISLLLVLVAYLQWPEALKVNNKNQRVVAVKTALITHADFKDTVEAIGTTRANEQITVTSKHSDLVEEIFFQDGQSVKQGDALIRLNSIEEKAKINELEANLAESVAQLERFQDLYQKKATSKSIVDQQEAKTKAIDAQLLSARTRLNDLTIRAPFSGVLGFREISLGALIDTGDVITSLDDLSIIKVDFAIPERFLTVVSVGQVIEATSTAYPEHTFIGTVSSIDSRVDRVTRTLKVRAEIPNKSLKLRAGMLLSLQVVRHVEKILQVPESAIIPIEDKHFVFAIKDGKSYKQSLTIGRRYQGFVEVLGGLSQGTQVVIEGALKLRDGTQVNILETSA